MLVASSHLESFEKRYNTLIYNNIIKLLSVWPKPYHHVDTIDLETLGNRGQRVPGHQIARNIA